jgi:metallo-beta-lactamase class B
MGGLMRRFKSFKALLCFTFILVLSYAAVAQDKAPESSKAQLSSDLFVEKLDEGVWLHVSRKKVEGFGLVPSNGLVIQCGTSALLVDTAWDDGQTKLLLDWTEKELKLKPLAVVITHYHADRLGGIGEVRRRGMKAISSELTAKLARENGSESPKTNFDQSLTLSYGGRDVLAKYAGAGHTRDNIVVWLPDRKILFGGCLVRAAQATEMGNTKDGDLEQWPRTIENLLQEFGSARIVIPGHGDPSGPEALTRTLELLKARR